MKAFLRWILGLALAGTGLGAGAASFIHLDNPSRNYTEADGTFSATNNYRGGVNVNFLAPSLWLDLEFAPAQGQSFTVGTYTRAQWLPVGSPTRPGLQAPGPTTGSCYTWT